MKYRMQTLSIFTLLLMTVVLAGCGGSDNSSDSISPQDDQQSPSTDVSEARTQVKRFSDDLQLWEGKLNVNPALPSFEGTIDSISVSATEEINTLLQVVALAGQYGAAVAVPEVALEAACDSLGNALAIYLCKTTIASNSLEQLCTTALNVEILGVSVCDILNNLTLPMTLKGLWGHYALYDGTARLYGQVEGVDVDIQLSAGVLSTNTIRFDLSGVINKPTSALSIEKGTLTFTYAEVVDGKRLVLPEFASVQVKGSVEQFSDGVMTSPVHFDGDISANITLKDLNKMNDGVLLGLQGVETEADVDGRFTGVNGDIFDGGLSLLAQDGKDLALSFITATPDFTEDAMVSVLANQEEINQHLLSFLVSWGERNFDVRYDTENPKQVVVVNQDGVTMHVDYDKEKNAGVIVQGGVTYANIDIHNGTIIVTLL